MRTLQQFFFGFRFFLMQLNNLCIFFKKGEFVLGFWGRIDEKACVYDIAGGVDCVHGS